MRFCLRPNAVSTDPAARIGYWLATGIESVQESSGAVPGYAEARQLDASTLVAQLEHLATLRSNGLLDEAEFETAKTALVRAMEDAG